MGRGLIEGAIGGLAKGAGEIAGGHIKNEMEVDLRKQLSDLEEQRQMRIMEATERNRRAGRQADFEQDVANAPTRTRLKIDELKATKPVETDLEVERTRKVGAATGETQREQEAAFADDPKAQAGVRARAKASDLGAAERALRIEELKVRIEEARLSAADKREMRDMLNQAAELKAGGNDDAAQQIIDTLRVKTGATAKAGGEKSYSDVIQGARVLEQAAKEAELDDPAEARRLRARAAELVDSVAGKRGVGAPKGGNPYPEGTRLRGKDGQIYVVKGGKPVLENSGRKASGTVTEE